MNRVLVELVAQYALFLERASEDTSLETVVRQQEDMAARLQQLDSSERDQFLDLLRQVAGDTTGEEREILLRFREDVGLA
jgi:hypothetical protein